MGVEGRITKQARAPRFKQVDLTRAMKALQAAGVRWGEIKIDPKGGIRILPEGSEPIEGPNEWDEVRKRRRLLPEWVTSYQDRTGKTRLRFRRTGFKPYTFKSDFGTEGFREEYRACLDGRVIEVGKDRAVPGSIRDLVTQYYRSQDFRNAGPASQEKNRGILEKFAEAHGTKSARSIKFIHIDKILGDKAEQYPAAARNLRKQLRRLFAFAVKIEMRLDNPVNDVVMPKNPSKGRHTWTEEEIAQYEAKHPLGTKARLALELMLWTGNRRSDAVHLGPGNVKDGRFLFTQDKGDKDMALLVSPQLAAAIAAMPPHDGPTFLVTEYGKPFTVDGFGGRFRKWCDEAGLPHCSAHGLRKAMARRLAELGESNQRIKAVGGWSGDAEVALYTRKASQMLMADAAIRNLSESHLANSRTQLAKLAGKSLESVVENEKGGGPGGTDIS